MADVAELQKEVAELRAVVESQAGLRDEVEALRAQVRRLPESSCAGSAGAQLTACRVSRAAAHGARRDVVLREAARAGGRLLLRRGLRARQGQRPGPPHVAQRRHLRRQLQGRRDGGLRRADVARRQPVRGGLGEREAAGARRLQDAGGRPLQRHLAGRQATRQGQADRGAPASLALSPSLLSFKVFR